MVIASKNRAYRTNFYERTRTYPYHNLLLQRIGKGATNYLRTKSIRLVSNGKESPYQKLANRHL